MEVNTVLKTLTIALSLAVDGVFVVGGVWMSYQFNLMRKKMLEADRAYAKAFPEVSELHQTNKLTLSLLWILIISCALGSLAYLLTVSKLYVFLFRG